jgi:hypothetical protein
LKATGIAVHDAPNSAKEDKLPCMQFQQGHLLVIDPEVMKGKAIFERSTYWNRDTLSRLSNNNNEKKKSLPDLQHIADSKRTTST